MPPTVAESLQSVNLDFERRCVHTVCMEPTQPTEGLDPKAVAGASKIMRALQAEHEARQTFEEAVSEAVQTGANAAVVRDDLKQRRATDRDMMTAAQAHRQAEAKVSEALTKLLDAAQQARYLQITTPGEFAFGFDEQPGTDEKIRATVSEYEQRIVTNTPYEGTLSPDEVRLRYEAGDK